MWVHRTIGFRASKRKKTKAIRTCTTTTVSPATIRRTVICLLQEQPAKATKSTGRGSMADLLCWNMSYAFETLERIVRRLYGFLVWMMD